MAITTLDGVIAGMLPPQFLCKVPTGVTAGGRFVSLFTLAGVPPAGAAPAASLNGSIHNAPLVGCFPFVDSVQGQYLARFAGISSAQSGILMLCDRLWSNGGINITSTSLQAIASPVWPARDNNGATNGDGILIGCEVTTVTGNGGPTITVGYTASDGTAGRSGVNLQATGNVTPATTFFPIGLQAGDQGVRSVQSITLSGSWTSGTINLVAYRVVAALELPGAGIPNAIDALTGGMPALYDGSCLFPIFIAGAAATTSIAGHFVQTNG